MTEAERIANLTEADHDIIEAFIAARSRGRLWLSIDEVTQALDISHEAHRPWPPLDLLCALQVVELIDFGGEQGYTLRDPAAATSGLRKAGRLIVPADGPRSRPSPLAERLAEWTAL